jgi:hypothetical protein
VEAKPQATLPLIHFRILLRKSQKSSKPNQRLRRKPFLVMRSLQKMKAVPGQERLYSIQLMRNWFLLNSNHTKTSVMKDDHPLSEDPTVH